MKHDWLTNCLREIKVDLIVLSRSFLYKILLTNESTTHKLYENLKYEISICCSSCNANEICDRAEFKKMVSLDAMIIGRS